MMPAATSDGYRPEKSSFPAPYPDRDWLVDGPRADTSSEARHTARPSQGRAARRRQAARWKKIRRRASAAAVVAFIGSGLTITALQSASSAGSGKQVSMPEPLSPAAIATSESTGPSSALPSTPVARHSSTHVSATTRPITPKRRAPPRRRTRSQPQRPGRDPPACPARRRALHLRRPTGQPPHPAPPRPPPRPRRPAPPRPPPHPPPRLRPRATPPRQLRRQRTVGLMVVRLDRDGPSKSTWLPARPGGPANAVLDGRFFLVRRPRSYVQLVSMRHSADPESMVRTTGRSPAAALRASAWTASICSRKSR
jgi:hypothetical protein